jgi:hypothetical protein
MKKLTISVMIMVCAISSAFAQIPNGGFENWTSMGSYSNPDNWDQFNAMTAPMSVYTATKGTPGSPGTAYLKLVSKAVAMMGVMPGIAVCGVLSTATYQPISGFAYAQRPQSFTGKYQYMASGSDVGFMAVYLTKWNTAMGMRDTVAMAIDSLTGMAMSWANFNINFMYMNGDTPDSAMIILSASGATPVANSYLYADNLAFSGSVAGIKENKLNAAVNLFPNPASDKLVVSITNSKAVKGQIEIYDVIGKKIKSFNEVDFTSNITIDIADLNKGAYLIKVNTSEGIITKNFLKQ